MDDAEHDSQELVAGPCGRCGAILERDEIAVADEDGLLCRPCAQDFDAFCLQLLEDLFWSSTVPKRLNWVW